MSFNVIPEELIVDPVQSIKLYNVLPDQQLLSFISKLITKQSPLRIEFELGAS
jgi:hypothetical protein